MVVISYSTTVARYSKKLKYLSQTNGGEILDGKYAAEVGNYNALMVDSPIYQKCK